MTYIKVNFIYDIHKYKVHVIKTSISMIYVIHKYVTVTYRM